MTARDVIPRRAYRAVLARAPAWLALASSGSSQAAYRLARERRMRLTATCEPALTRLPRRDPVHVCHARRRARVLLAAWGLGKQTSIGELGASELARNAVCRGETPTWIRLSIGDGDLRVEVHEGGASRPVRKHADGGDECRRPALGPGKTVYVVLSMAVAR
jgi:hypothetical protein